MKRIKSVSVDAEESDLNESSECFVWIHYYGGSSSTRIMKGIEELELHDGDCLFKNKVIGIIELPELDKMKALTSIEFENCIL